MAKDPTLKKKRKSEAAAMDVDPPAEGTASGTAVVAEAIANSNSNEEPPKKKSKKDKSEKKEKKSKSAAGDVTAADTTVGDVTMDGGEIEGEGKKEKKEKKDKKDKKEKEGKEKKAKEYDPILLSSLTPLATPLAPPTLSRSLLRTLRKCSSARQLRRGVKEVLKALRKGEQGLLILAGNITPVDVISHLPVMAEECKGVEYVWVGSKEELGMAAGTKRATSVVLLCTQPKKRTPAKPKSKSKDGSAPASSAPTPASQTPVAQTQEQIDEWQKPLLECIKEVKALPVTKVSL